MEEWDWRRALAALVRGEQAARFARALGLPAEPKAADAIRVGILGASKVATYALIWPARRLPDVQVAAVAARDADRAQEYAQQHGIPRSYGAYEDLVADPSLDAIYVALPNGLHGEWTAKALRAGKHVLCEKPFTANADEARAVQKISRSAGLLAREAFHYKEHPANQQVASLLANGGIGKLQSFSVCVLIPRGIFGAEDIRWKPSLAGGTMMDAGCYCAHALRYFAGMQPQVINAAAQGVFSGMIDKGMKASFTYSPTTGPVGRLEASLAHPGVFPVSRVSAEGTRGSLQLDNFIVPFLGHDITWTQYEDNGGQTIRHFKAYGSGESNYYYQLDRFVKDLQTLNGCKDSKSRSKVRASMDDDDRDCVDNMSLIDAVYAAAGLPARQPTNKWS